MFLRSFEPLVSFSKNSLRTLWDPILEHYDPKQLVYMHLALNRCLVGHRWGQVPEGPLLFFMPLQVEIGVWRKRRAQGFSHCVKTCPRVPVRAVIWPQWSQSRHPVDHCPECPLSAILVLTDFYQTRKCDMAWESGAFFIFFLLSFLFLVFETGSHVSIELTI